jgi:hypothetical protein
MREKIDSWRQKRESMACVMRTRNAHGPMSGIDIGGKRGRIQGGIRDAVSSVCPLWSSLPVPQPSCNLHLELSTVLVVGFISLSKQTIERI